MTNDENDGARLSATFALRAEGDRRFMDIVSTCEGPRIGLQGSDTATSISVLDWRDGLMYGAADKLYNEHRFV